MTRGESHLTLARISGQDVDANISAMAQMRMGDVVRISEGVNPEIGFPHGAYNAARFLVARLFTDAVFNSDVRAMQLIINRVDGGLPRDVDVNRYRTLFGDCMQQVVSCTDGTQLKVLPDDTVMMAMCKSLYDMAVRDIYVNPETGRKRRPTDSEKKERDAAMKIVLDRCGGRRTLESVEVEKEDVEVAPWIAQLGESTC